MNRDEVFLYKNRCRFPKHSLDNLVRWHSSSPGKCGTDLPHVVGFGKDPRVCLVNGRDQKQGDCASVHLLSSFWVDEYRIFAPRFGKAKPVV